MKITTKENVPTYNRDGITSYLLVSEITTASKHITTTLVEMEKDGKQHIHSHSTEQCYFILEGKGLMRVGEEEEEVITGESIFIPSNESHGLKNIGTGTLRYLSAGSPPFGRDKERELWPDLPLSKKGEK